MCPECTRVLRPASPLRTSSSQDSATGSLPAPRRALLLEPRRPTARISATGADRASARPSANPLRCVCRAGRRADCNRLYGTHFDLQHLPRNPPVAGARSEPAGAPRAAPPIARSTARPSSAASYLHSGATISGSFALAVRVVLRRASLCNAPNKNVRSPPRAERSRGREHSCTISSAPAHRPGPPCEPVQRQVMLFEMIAAARRSLWFTRYSGSPKN